jgi:hypothetical protein
MVGTGRIATALAGALLESILIAGCSSAGPAPASASTSITFDLSTTVTTAQPERYVCEFVQMPAGSDPIYVDGGSFLASAGTHHFLLFRTSLAAPPSTPGQEVDCFEGEGVMQYERGFVTGGQTLSDEAHFTPGLALAFQPGDVLLVQWHLLDATDHDLDASLHINLDTVDASTVTTRVGTLRYYDPYIYVPANAPATAHMRCHLHHDITLLLAAPHMHALGVGFRAYLDLPGAPLASTPFYTTDTWSGPPPWTGVLAAPAGSDIRYECDYRNGGDTPVVQGLSETTNEMCMLSAFYVPETDGSDDDCSSMDELGTGTQTCAQTTSCLQQCSPSDEPHFETGNPTVGACWQQCITQSCQDVAATLLPQLECTQTNCSTACATFGVSCTQCVIDRCPDEVQACQSQACGP